MAGVVKPAGVQIYRVLGHRPADYGYAPEPPEQAVAATGLRRLTRRDRRLRGLSTLLDVALRGLADHLCYPHSMVLMADPDGTRLYAVASHGHSESGAGAEVAFGEDVIGVAAAERHPIVIAHMARERLSNRWVRRRMADAGADSIIERNIPLTGLPMRRAASWSRCSCAIGWWRP